MGHLMCWRMVLVVAAVCWLLTLVCAVVVVAGAGQGPRVQEADPALRAVQVRGSWLLDSREVAAARPPVIRPVPALWCRYQTAGVSMVEGGVSKNRRAQVRSKRPLPVLVPAYICPRLESVCERLAALGSHLQLVSVPTVGG